MYFLWKCVTILPTLRVSQSRVILFSCLMICISNGTVRFFFEAVRFIRICAILLPSGMVISHGSPMVGFLDFTRMGVGKKTITYVQICYIMYKTPFMEIADK